MARFLSALFVCLTVTACSSVTPGGLIAAARLDPLTTPPNTLLVAISVPQAVRLSDGDAELALSYTPDDDVISEPVGARVPLMIREDAGAPQPASANRTVYVLSLSAQDARRLSVVQQQIRGLKAANVDGAGSLSVQVVGGCVRAATPEVLPVGTWIQTADDTSWVRLTRATDVFQALPAAEAEALRAQLKACDIP